MFRFDIFNTVDDVMILSKGHVVYNGGARDMVGYFTSLGFPCPDLTNPCDFYSECCRVGGAGGGGGGGSGGR